MKTVYAFDGNNITQILILPVLSLHTLIYKFIRSVQLIYTADDDSHLR